MNSVLKEPVFIISIDVELIWGYISDPDSKALLLLRKDETKGRGAIDFLLNIFEKYAIPATWALVGHLFLDQCKKNGQPHEDMPRFKDDWYSQDPCSNIKEAPLFYGRDIVEKILSSRVKHEIGYHSFSHVPFSECSQEVAEAELKRGVELARDFGIQFKSFVYPKNKIGHVEILKENGFKIYRGRNSPSKYINRSLPIRATNFVLRRLIAPTVEPIWQYGIWEIPSSMTIFDPFIPQTIVLRAKLGIQKTIIANKIFHIFLHPEDLLLDPRLINKLNEILAFVWQKREEGRLQVATMGELASKLPVK